MDLHQTRASLSAPGPRGEDTEGQRHHTFHLPNSFARSSAGDSLLSSSPKPPTGKNSGRSNGDDDDGDDGDSVSELEDNDGAEHDTLVRRSRRPVGTAPTGVEDTSAWRHMSKTQRVAVRAAFGILGAAVLLPFNALITPSEFYRALLRGTPHEVSIMSWLVVVYNVSSIIFGAHATSSMHKKSIAARITWASVLILSLLVATTALTGVVVAPSVGLSGTTFAFPAVLVVSFVLAAATSYLQLAVVTLANAFGAVSMTAMLSGQGMVGAVVSLVQLITTLVSIKRSESGEDSGEEALAAASFYGAATLFMVLAVGTFLVLNRTEMYAEMQAQIGTAKHSLQTPVAPVVEDSNDNSNMFSGVLGVRRYMSTAVRCQYDRILSVQRRVVLACFCIAYIFIVTLAVFPALTSRVRPTASTNGTADTSSSAYLVFVAWHFVAFNTGDLIGRTLPGIAPQVFCLERMGVIALMTVLRTAFVPLLALCNVAGGGGGGGGGGANVTAIVTSAASSPLGSGAFFVLVIVLGLSNGLLAVCVFVAGPSSPSLHTADERSLAAGLLSWWLTIGLAIGSIASFSVGAF